MGVLDRVAGRGVTLCVCGKHRSKHIFIYISHFYKCLKLCRSYMAELHSEQMSDTHFTVGVIYRSFNMVHQDDALAKPPLVFCKHLPSNTCSRDHRKIETY